jgi:hypothetical protein
MRMSDADAISDNFRGCACRDDDSVRHSFLPPSDFVTTSSANEFHAPHDGHLPSHLADSYPHALQKNNVFVLAISEDFK